MKSHRPFVYYCPPKFLFLSIEVFSFPCQGLLHVARGSLWLQTVNCNSLLTPNELIFVGEVSGSQRVSGQPGLHCTQIIKIHALSSIQVYEYKEIIPLKTNNCYKFIVQFFYSFFIHLKACAKDQTGERMACVFSLNCQVSPPSCQEVKGTWDKQV